MMDEQYGSPLRVGFEFFCWHASAIHQMTHSSCSIWIWDSLLLTPPREYESKHTRLGMRWKLYATRKDSGNQKSSQRGFCYPPIRDQVGSFC